MFLYQKSFGERKGCTFCVLMFRNVLIGCKTATWCHDQISPHDLEIKSSGFEVVGTNSSLSLIYILGLTF